VIQGWLNGGIQIPRALRTIAPSSSHFQQEAVVAMQATDDLQVMGAGSERGDLLLLAEGKEAITVQLW
jgi:hypothetical protein